MKTQTHSNAMSSWKQSGIELGILYVLTTVAATTLFQMHWLWAMLITPFLMLVTLGGIAVMVQSLWMLVVGMERVGTACGVRKSPLA